jgi:hypothetical protein
LTEEFLGSLVIALGVGGLGVQDQPAGGNLLPVLLPQVGAAGVQGGGLVGELLGGAQVSGPVGLVGGHSGAVGPHVGAVVGGSDGSGILVLVPRGDAGSLVGGLDPVMDASGRRFPAAACPWSAHGRRMALGRPISGKLINTTPPGGIEYWTRLAAVINSNPVQEHDRFYMAMLKPLGIEKGQPFKPDARQQAILEDAAVLGDAMARNVMYEGSQRETGVTAFPGTQWDWVFYVKPSQETET